MNQIVENCHVDEEEFEYLKTRHHRIRKKNTALEHKRILAEFNMSFVTLIDQLNDAVTLLAYLLFWGSTNDWIHGSSESFLLVYDISWELSTTTQPFLLLILCSEVRKCFIKSYGGFLICIKKRLFNRC
uniref:Uncharacterized protein n=1 Tax=Panagrolaimus sp. JU765 TaxID=591449 RepID=A0AC34RDW9_9BILA